jgi:ATP-dependent DNA helicase DinG
LPRWARCCERSGSYGKLRLKEPDEHAFLAPGLQGLVDFFVTIEQRLGGLRDVLNTLSQQRFAGLDTQIAATQRRAPALHGVSGFAGNFCEPDFENRAYWFSSFQAADPDTPNGMLNAAPLNIDDILDDQLFSRVSSLVCTSATLALRGSFKYFTHRVGLDRRETLRELVVPSPFDYEEQCRVAVAGFLPDPTKDEKFFHAQALSLLRDLIIRARVGSMVLFTSHRDLLAAADYLAQPLYEQDIPLLVQRDNAGRTPC